MKVLILYTTKYGATELAAQMLADNIECETILHNLKDCENIPDISSFESVIVGSPIYAGGFLKEARKFINKHKEELRKCKILGFFSCGLGNSDDFSAVKNNIPEDLFENEHIFDYIYNLNEEQMARLSFKDLPPLHNPPFYMAFGGISNPEKANFFERLILRIATKSKSYINKIDKHNIKAFAFRIKIYAWERLKIDINS